MATSGDFVTAVDTPFLSLEQDLLGLWCRIGHVEKFGHVRQAYCAKFDVLWAVLQDFPSLGHAESSRRWTRCAMTWDLVR